MHGAANRKAMRNGSAGARTGVRSGFTIIELAVVAVVLTALMSVLLPVIHHGRGMAGSAECLNSLKTIGQDTQLYTQAFGGFFPPASVTDRTGITVSWDGGVRMHEPSKLPDDVFEAGTDWEAFNLSTVNAEREKRVNNNNLNDGGGVGPKGDGDAASLSAEEVVRQRPLVPPLMIFSRERAGAGPEMAGTPLCPAYDPDDASGYTGYNYNTDYLGRGPAIDSRVRHPAETAVYGDGASRGPDGTELPNKFMRAPAGERRGNTLRAGIPVAGTQAFRHLGGTNVLWADYHASTWKDRQEQTANTGLTAGRGTGWLSADDTLYDLK
jgi:prepilin-type processing-associated H-X9-DG protein